MAPLVSTIIPTRDRPELLERAVASALAQTWSPLEVVVADNGSEPPAREFDDPRVVTIRLAEPDGAAAGRNAAIAQARGELLAFLDDDDEWRPEKTAKQVERMRAGGPDLAGVSCGYDWWDGPRLAERVPPPAGDLRRELLSNPCMAPSTVLVRKDVVEAAGGFDPAIHRCEDWDLWVRLADRHAFEALPEVLADRRKQAVPPEEELATYAAMVERLSSRIDALPPAERERVRAHHDLVLGVHHARMGRSSEARALMWSAWRRRPSSPRPLLHMARTFIGEPIWEGSASRLRRVWARAPGSARLRSPR